MTDPARKSILEPIKSKLSELFLKIRARFGKLYSRVAPKVLDHALGAFVTLLVTATVTAGAGLTYSTWFRSPESTPVAMQESPTSDTGEVSLVDVFLDPEFTSSTAPTTLDIRVRNSSEEVAFFTSASINIMDSWIIPWSLPIAHVVPVSWSYDIALPPDAESETVTIPISQGVQPNGLDRFTLAVGMEDNAPSDYLYVFLATLTLEYNEDDSTLTSSPLLLAIDQSGCGTSCADFSPIVSEALREISSIDAIRSSSLEDILFYYGMG